MVLKFENELLLALMIFLYLLLLDSSHEQEKSKFHITVIADILISKFSIVMVGNFRILEHLVNRIWFWISVSNRIAFFLDILV